MSDQKEHMHILLVFHASGLDCAFPLGAVREIVPMAKLSSPPGMPSGLAGLLDFRGTAVPIIRLDRLFSLPEQQPGLHTPMIVLHGLLGLIGVLVDSVRVIVTVSSAQLLAIPEDRTFRGCATAVLQLDGNPVHLLSPAALLTANESHMMADYGALSQSRLFDLQESK